MTKRKPQPKQSPKTSRSSHSASAHLDIIYGFHAVKAALGNPKRQLKQLYASQNAAASLKNDGLDVPVQLVSASELARYAPEDAVHQGIVGLFSPLAPIDLENLTPDGGPVILLDQITDPHNIGAIMRSAAVFGAQAVITADHHSPTLTGTLAKAASGALEHIPLITVKNIARALDQLKKHGFFVVGLAEGGANMIDLIEANTGYVLVMGAEGRGMRRLTREHCDFIAEIPCSSPDGHFTTLNVSNAAAVALFIAQQARRT